MDLVSDFKERIESSTLQTVLSLNKIYKNISHQKKDFIREINKFYIGIRILFHYMSGEEKQVVLSNNILLDMCSLLHCVVLGDVKLIFFLYRNIIESFLRYLTKDYDSKNLDGLFNIIDGGTSGKEKQILEKYKSQIKDIYTECCRYIHVNIKNIPKNIYDLKKYDTYIKNDLSTEKKKFQQLSVLIISILEIKYNDKYRLLKGNSKAYIDEIMPRKQRTEYAEVMAYRRKR